MAPWLTREDEVALAQGEGIGEPNQAHRTVRSPNQRGQILGPDRVVNCIRRAFPFLTAA